MARSYASRLLGRSTADDLLDRALTHGVPFTPGPETASASTGALSLAEYRRVVRDLPPLESDHMQMFAEYVSKAHSWYKHLPLVSPGVEFTFLINPCVMMEDMPPRSGDRRRFRPYRDKEQLLHYSTMRTETYHQEFGYLAYCMKVGPIAIPIPIRASNQEVVEAQLRRVPHEVSDECTTILTAAIHPLTARTWVWKLFSARSDLGTWTWPAESGGRERLDRILAICNERERDTDEVSPELVELLRDERERQIRGMVNAMERLKALLWV